MSVPQLRLGTRRALWAYTFLFVPLLFYIAIRLGPAFSSLYISLHEWNLISPSKPFVGLQNFRLLAHDRRFVQAAVNTVRYVLVGIPVQMALGLAVAVLLQRINRFRGLFRALYFMPFVTPIVAAAWVWQWMYSESFGPLNEILATVGLPLQPFLRSPGQALYAVAAMIIWQYLGFQIVIFLAGLEAIPRVYYEAAEVDGASGWRLFRHITVPLLNPTLVFSVVYGTIVFLQLFTQVLNMTFGDQGGPLAGTLTVVLYVYQLGFQRLFGNSLIVATITTVSVAFFDSLVGYVLAKLQFPGRGFIFVMILATLMIPTEMLVIPWYIMSSAYGWINSYWGIMFPGLMSAFGVFLIRQFMSGVPDELLDAGRTDGVTELGLYWRIALPQIRPALAALCIFTFLGNWNAFLWPLIVIQGADMRTLPVGIALFSGEAGSSWNLIMASSALAVLPVLAVFVVLQRQIIEGVTLTGLRS